MNRIGSLELVLFSCALLLLFSCSTDNDNTILNETVLTAEEESFLEEYEFLTFKLDPNSSGAPLSEKWNEEVRIFLDGEISPDYRADVTEALSIYNNFFTNGVSCILVDAVSESNVRVVLGEKEAIEMLWPDMYSLINGGNFSGYALYNYNANHDIVSGRIWVNNTGMPIFRHELGHVLGFGHASTAYCGSNVSNKSFMCSSLSIGFSDFDEGIIKTLYHPNIEVGRTFEELRPVVEALLLSDEIVF